MKKNNWLALLIVLIFLVSGIATLSNYGISWDEGLGNMFFGERYYYFFTTLQEKYLDFNTELAVHGQHPLNLYVSPFRQYPNEFPALADTLSAATMHLVSYRLHWMDPVDAFHLFTILLTGLFLWILYRFAARRMGGRAALFSLLFLAAFPRLWGDMHFNPKDVPEMVFFSLTILAYLSWYEKPSWQKALLSGLLFGCALGIKANALFIPFILMIGVWHWNIFARPWNEHFRHIRSTVWHYVLMAAGAGLVYFLSWPYFYGDVRRVTGYFKYILSQGSRTGSPGWNWEPLLQTITTMPEIMLLFLVVGLAFVFMKCRTESSAWWRLLPVWLLLPLVRASLPGMVNFDGIRHFLEFVPAAALIAGLGVDAAIEKLSADDVQHTRWLSAAASVLILLNILYIHAVYNPFQHLFYNRLAGGLQGAAEIFGADNASDYWAVSYRQGMDWLDEHAAQDSILYVPVADWLVRLPAPLWLRDDIELTSRDFADTLQESQRPVYVMFITRSAFYDDIAEFCVDNLQPVHAIRVDGVNVLEIYLLNEAEL